MTAAGSFVAYIHPAVGTQGFDAATHAIGLPSNSSRHLAHRPVLPSEKLAREPRVAQPARRSRTSRHTTEEPEEHDALLYTACLTIDIGQPPKTPLGVVGGRNPDLDLYFGDAVGASWNHLSFTFNKDYHFIVRDLGSTAGTTVIYGTHENGPKRNDEWIIGGHKFLEDKGPITVKVTENLQFRAVVPAYNPACPGFRAKVDTFRKGSTGFDDLFSDLQVTIRRSETRLQTSVQTPSRGSTLTWKLGEGTFGVVHYVCDCRTGREVARKTPKPGYNARSWRKEVLLMARVKHPHIVAILDYGIHPIPFLDLEFVPGRSLSEHLQEEKYFSGIECVKVARQSTSAVAYLHGLRENITHRDISTNNIFVAFRNVDDLSIKLADFGLSKEGNRLQTWAGTPAYCAPEFYGVRTDNGKNMVREYTPAVDMWSLGVVLAELLCGLPKRRKSHEEDGLLWCQHVREHVQNHPDDAQDDMMIFLLQTMLSLEPEGRSPAQECHEKSLRLSEGTHDTWKSIKRIESIAEGEEDSASESDRPESEQETIQAEVGGSGTARTPAYRKDRGTAGAPPPSDMPPSSNRPNSQQILARWQNPEDSLFRASQIGDDERLSETDGRSPTSLHNGIRCADTPPPETETLWEPSVIDPIPSSKRTREWEAEVNRMLRAGLDTGLPSDVNRDAHMAKRPRQHDLPTVVSSLESSA